MIGFLKPLFAAVGFLTAAKVPAGWMGDEKDLGRSLAWFPVVGAMIGGAAALADRAFAMALPPLAAATLTAAFMIAASGALHLDGLADTADGFFSSRPRERMLEIMKDSRIGTMGVAAIVVVFALKVSLLSALPSGARSGVVFMMPLAGRFAPSMMITTMKYVREGGLGQVFAANRNIINPLFLLAVAAACGWLLMGKTGLAVAAATVVLVVVFSSWCRSKIGGYTGDTIGAAIEVCELVPPLVFFVVARIMERI